MRRLILLLPIAGLILGCNAAPLEFNRFDPVIYPPYMKTVIQDNEKYVSYEDTKYKVNTVVLEYQGILLTNIVIDNKTARDIDAKDYSIQLCDGRDYKPLKMVSRKDIAAIKATYTGNASGGNIQDQAIAAASAALLEIFQPSSKSQIIQGLDKAIDNYFSFRPIYAHESRSGIISFVADFKLEYPLTFIIKLENEKIELAFKPVVVNPQ
ncbi:MAG: hypothetical protein V1843_02650 [bacterium]